MGTAANAETIYRDKAGKKITKEEWQKTNQKPKKKRRVFPEQNLEWGAGLVQKKTFKREPDGTILQPAQVRSKPINQNAVFQHRQIDSGSCRDTDGMGNCVVMVLKRGCLRRGMTERTILQWYRRSKWRIGEIGRLKTVVFLSVCIHLLI